MLHIAYCSPPPPFFLHFFLGICWITLNMPVDTKQSLPAVTFVGRSLPEACSVLATAWRTCLEALVDVTSSGERGTAWLRLPLQDLGDCSLHVLLINSNSNQCQQTSHISAGVNACHIQQLTSGLRLGLDCTLYVLLVSTNNRVSIQHIQSTSRLSDKTMYKWTS